MVADDTLPARFFDDPIHEGDWTHMYCDHARFTRLYADITS